MEELCPDAWLINFTNPSGIITETILNHSKIKGIGLCNCPVGMQNEFAEKFGCHARDVYIDFVGLNHLLWAQKILVRGEDMTEKIVAGAHENDEIMKNIPDINVGAAFYKSLGMLPIGYLKYYYLTKEMYDECVRQAEGVGVRGEVVKKVEDDLFALYDDPGLDIKPPQLSDRGGAHYSDAACDLICSIFNDKRDIQVVSAKNNGANLDLPNDAVIERNCVIGKGGAEPIPLGRMPLKVRGLVQIVKAYEQLTIEAGVHGDRDAAWQALVAHPLVPSANVAKEMLDELIRANSDFLPQFN
jgi:6-phospho-beta-glucosidase